MSDPRHDSPFAASDIGAAFSLLTRLPVSVDHALAGQRAAEAVWAYPLAGAILGALAGIVGGLAQALGAPVGISAALALATLVLGTGAMHEDGLADCADGLGGGRDRQNRLQIMHDSRIGAYGATALGLALIARWSGIAGLMSAQHLFWPMVAIGAVSRLPMVLALFLIQPARRDGLSASLGIPPPPSVAGALALATLIGLFAVGWSVFPLLLWGLLAPLPLFWLAGRRLGGQTGDVLGASQQLAEIAALAVMSA